MFTMIRNITSYLKSFVDSISFFATNLFGQTMFSTSSSSSSSGSSKDHSAATASAQAQSGSAPNAGAYTSAGSSTGGGYYNYSYDYGSGSSSQPGAQYTTSGSSGYTPQYSHQFARPIDDLNKAIETKTDEDYLRCKLASLMRVISSKEGNTSVYDSITVRIKEKPGNYLINPYGLLFSEVTASSLLEIDSNCNVVNQGTTLCTYNELACKLNSKLYRARKDVNVIVHLHMPNVISLSALKYGFMPISQQAIMCGGVSYHTYEGFQEDENEEVCQNMIDDLGPKNKIMIMNNSGILVCGKTVEEAWFLLSYFINACNIQMRALEAAGGDAEMLITPPEEVIERAVVKIERFFETGTYQYLSGNSIPVNWKVGEIEFEAELRQLDLTFQNTGYKYKTFA